METVLSIIAIAFSLVSGLFSLYSFLWTARRDRKEATLEAFNRLQTEVFDKLNMYTPAEIEEICTDHKCHKYKELSGYLARIEHFCVGLNQRIYDRNTFFALAHGYFDGDQIRNRLAPLLKTKNQRSAPGELFYNDTISVLRWMEKKAGKNEHKTS